MILSQVPAEVIFEIFSYLEFIEFKDLVFPVGDYEYYLEGSSSGGSTSSSNSNNSSSSSSSSELMEVEGGGGGGNGLNGNGPLLCSLPIRHLFGEHDYCIDRFCIFLKIKFLESVPNELKLTKVDTSSIDTILYKLRRLFIDFHPMRSKSELKRIGFEFEEERRRIRLDYKTEKYLNVIITNENLMHVCKHYRHAMSMLLKYREYGVLYEHHQITMGSTIPRELLTCFKKVYENLVRPLKNIHDENAMKKNPYVKALLVVINSLNECAKYFKALNRGVLVFDDNFIGKGYPLPVEVFSKFWKYLDHDPLYYEPLLHMVTSFTRKERTLVKLCNYFSNMKPPLPPTAIVTQKDYDKFFELFKLLSIYTDKVSSFAIFDLLFFESFEDTLKKTLYFKNNSMKVEEFTQFIYDHSVE